ncbi:paxillin [Phyllostomus discolor]|uniref:Paxillin n=1 Tax=Phyllostomus discolor TaxID=89673 RepID=A0A833YY82_9CHIR|nr:paxillin [Phyllostomus discolor]
MSAGVLLAPSSCPSVLPRAHLRKPGPEGKPKTHSSLQSPGRAVPGKPLLSGLGPLPFRGPCLRLAHPPLSLCSSWDTRAFSSRFRCCQWVGGGDALTLNSLLWSGPMTRPLLPSRTEETASLSCSPPLKPQGPEQRADGEPHRAAGWPPSGRQSSPEGRHEGRFMAQGKTGSSSPPGGPPKPGSQLDSMLGSLQSDLNKLGVATVAKGVCGACKKPIAGQVVTAMGKTWHPEHFVCTHCQEEIGSRNFFERDGQPYCEKDYHTLFSPRCYYCNGPILDKVVTALDRTWHPEHFFCAQCGAFFGPEGFHEKDGKAYCRKDYFDMFAPKCGGCARAILENYISALNTLWHPECFVCRECFTPFVNGSFFEHDGQPYCEVHYHERRGSLCSGCQKPITGRCITAMAKKFHPEHFVCAFCLKQLNKGTFKEQNDKPYCQNCFLKLFC